MADKTAIEWTDATWNPIRARNRKTGKVGWHCTHVTAGCANCYAEGWNKRLGTGMDYKPGHEADIEIYLDEKMLEQPLRWSRPRKIFPCSMTDLFAKFVKDEWIERVVKVMCAAHWHTFQPLTKRPERARLAFEHMPAPKNMWLGVSVEDQEQANDRIPLLLQTRVQKRWLSCEPLLGPVSLMKVPLPNRVVPGIDWVVAGGESGKDARPMHPDWARSLRDQCDDAGIPFLFKQWGEFIPAGDLPFATAHSSFLTPWAINNDGTPMSRVGKKRAGRLLDGVEHNGYPA